MSIDLGIAHSHQASWRTAAGATEHRRVVASTVLPWLKSSKQAIVALGAGYFDGDDALYSFAADRLQVTAGNAAAALRDALRDDRDDDIIRSLAAEFTALEVLAGELRRATPEESLISQVRTTYSRIRELGSALWEFEYIFEGNPRPGGDFHV